MSGITVPTLDEITGHTVMAKLRSLCKRFIGLAEEVDEKIDAPLEEAHQAVQTANTASANAQQSVVTANQAVQTANTASANANEASESAHESAETVAGYNTRLTAVENGKINITDINNYAVGLTGNQIKSGSLTLLNPLIGVAGRTLIDSNATDVDKYKMLFKISKSQSLGIRQHLTFEMWTRQRARTPDYIAMFISTNSLDGFDMILRTNTDNRTYIASYDDNYIYVGIPTTNSLADSIQVVLKGATVGFNLSQIISPGEEEYLLDSVPGTEYKRLVP